MTKLLASSTLSLEDDLDAIYERFESEGYGDGLPFIPPTAERIRRMIAGCSRRADESIGKIPPANFEATVEKIAINAVMAGCKPDYMPILIAAVETMVHPSWDLRSLQTTTNPLTPLLLVNGPERLRTQLNSGMGAMGPGWRSNSTIGRALRLIMLNIGGAKPGDVDKCTQGFVGKFGLCMAENEEESPWPPYHVSRGFKAEDSVATVIGVNASTNIHDSSDSAKDLIYTLTASLTSPGTANVVDPHSTPVLLLNPLHARILNDVGFTREKLQQHIFENSTMPADALSPRREKLRRDHGDEHYLVNGKMPFANTPGQIHIMVVGGLGGGHSCYLPNGHYGYARSTVIST